MTKRDRSKWVRSEKNFTIRHALLICAQIYLLKQKVKMNTRAEKIQT